MGVFLCWKTVSFRLVFCGLSGSGSWLLQFEQGDPDTPLPSQFQQLLWGETKMFQGLYVLGPPLVSSQMDMPKTYEMARRYPYQMPEPPQLAPLNTEEQQLYSEPPLPISKAEPIHLAKETHLGHLY